MRWRTIALALCALALATAATGCGGGDDEASGDTDTFVATDTTSDTTSDDTTTDDTTTDETETGGGGILPGDCLDAVAAFTALSQAVAAAGASGDDAEESARVFQEFADKAPEAVRDAIRVLGDAYAEYIAVLSNLGLEAGETPSADQIQELTQASEALNSADVLAASESFSTWASANCPG